MKLPWNRILHIPVFFGDAANSLEDIGFQTTFVSASMRALNMSQFRKAKRINVNAMAFRERF